MQVSLLMSNTDIIPSFIVHHYKNQYSNTHIGSKELNLSQLVSYLAHSEVSSDKYHAGTYIIGEMADTHRNDDNILNRQAICIDIDDLPADTTLVEDVENMFGFSYILYTTFNHRKDAPRYRLVIPLLKPITKRHYKAAIRFFEEQLKVKADEKSYTWSQCMARNVKQSQDADYLFKHQETYCLDTEKLINGLDKYMEVTASSASALKRSDDHWQVISWGRLSEGEYIGRNSALASLTGHLMRSNVNISVIVGLLSIWNSTLNPPLSEKEFERTVQSIIKSELKRRGGA